MSVAENARAITEMNDLIAGLSIQMTQLVNDNQKKSDQIRVGSPEEGFEIVAGDSLDFDSWILLISEIEKTYSDNIKAISSVYESFLYQFPLCHVYWRRYADHVSRLCTVEKAVEIFEQAVQSATYSVDVWVDYCSFSVLAFADPSDVRRIFERGLSFVGKDFLCHRLWDMYIRFELSQHQWSFLAHILIRALKFPTKSLHKYYDNFKEFAAFVEEDMSFSKSGNLEPHAADSDKEVAASNDKIHLAIKELQDSSSVDQRTKALNKLIAIGEQFYCKSCKLHEEIDYFENYMDRDFFNVKPLDDEELQNWHNYLDFIEKQEDFDWAVKLYERCLIPCANYPEFWMRYVEFMETKGGRELANFALERATQVFLKNVSEVHIFNARFREKIGDIEGARAAFHLCDTESDSSFIETATNEANMETRLGNMDTALEVYDKALKKAAEKEKMHIIPILYIHFFHLKFLITGSADAAIDLLMAGIQQVPFSRLLLEELINFAMMHEGSKYLDVVEGIIGTAITCGSDGSQGLSSGDREDLSNLYLKFVDYCGTTHDIRKAWNRHIRLFPHLIRSTSSHKYPSNRLSNEPRERIPRLVAKQPSRVHSIKHIARISANENHKLTSKNQAIEPHEAAGNRYGEKDDDNSVTEITRSQQSKDNVAGELKRLELQPRNESQNDLPVSQKDYQSRTEQQEHEGETCTKPVSLEKEPNKSADKQNEDTRSPSTANQNPFPFTESANKQNETNEREPETDLQQTPSQNVETCLSNRMPTASEQVRQLSNQDHQNVPNVLPENHPSSASELHLLPQNVQPTVQYPVPSSEQPGVIQNPQAYNQMLQYQYQQQHQNQQQWLQMQQPCQQPYIQQQQQFQPQQYQYYQQLEQYQQYWFQMYQQQQQQQQQQQLQQYTMQMQQYQQMQQQQGQGTISPNTTMPYTQPNCANVVVQPMAAPAPTNITSPNNHQQPSDTKSLCSPSIE